MNQQSPLMLRTLPHTLVLWHVVHWHTGYAEAVERNSTMSAEPRLALLFTTCPGVRQPAPPAHGPIGTEPTAVKLR